MRLLITADWHINNYKNYNSFVNFRLSQFVKLAHQTVELGKEQNCPILVIAGDFIDIPILSPKIQHVVKTCIDILKKGFDKIYYILGQHDLDTKGIINRDDTILSLYDDEKFIYMNHKTIEYDGVTIGFQNWTHEQDTEWIEEPLDVLIGHYTKSTLFGQEIDESKFGLMIHGDIHNSQVIGKFVSICNPIQKDMSSEASGSMIVYDTSTKRWERIRTDEPHEKYLRIEYTRNPEEEGWVSPILYKIFKPVEVSASGESFEVPIPEWSEIDELIQATVKQRNFKDIHEEVLANTQAFQEIDFNFQLKYIDIHGYRSVEDMHIEFKGNDIILLLGDNGSGKSSVISALQHLFYYDTHLQDNATHFEGEDPEALQLDFGLFYQGKMYTIHKGAKWGLEIDGVEVGFPSKPKFENGLPEYLPFLNYPDVFFISSEASDLTGCYSSERRSELLSKFYKFDRVLSYRETALRLREEAQPKYGEIEKEVNDCCSVQKYLEGQLTQYEEPRDLEMIQSDIEVLANKKVKAEQYRGWLNSKKIIEDKISLQKSNLSKIQKPKDLEELTESLKLEQASLEACKINITSLRSKLDEFKAILKEDSNINNDIKRLENSLAAIVDDKCPTCGQVINSEKKVELRKDTEFKIEQLKVKKSNLVTKLQEVDPLLDSLKDINLEVVQRDIESKQKELSQFESKVNGINSDIANSKAYESSTKPIKDSISNLEKELEELEKQNVKECEFSEKNEESLKELNRELDDCKTYNKLKTDLETKKKEEVEIRSRLEPMLQRIENLHDYALMMSPTGEVYSAILRRLAKSFTSETVEWYVEEGTYRNKDFLIFQAKMKVKKTWREYDTLSAGQKNVVDIDFLGKMLATRSGILVLDETLKHLDTNRSVEAAESLAKFNVNSLLIATHSISFPEYTQKLRLELDEKGRTQILSNLDDSIL